MASPQVIGRPPGPFRFAAATEGAFSFEPVHASVAAMPRRFPPPWSVEEHSECFAVTDANGQRLAFVYFEDNDSRRTAMNRLTRDEARRIAANFAKLPAFIEADKDRPREGMPCVRRSRQRSECKSSLPRDGGDLGTTR